MNPIKVSSMMLGDWVVFGVDRIPPLCSVPYELCEARRLRLTADENPSEFVDVAINMRIARLNAHKKQC